MHAKLSTARKLAAFDFVCLGMIFRSFVAPVAVAALLMACSSSASSPSAQNDSNEDAGSSSGDRGAQASEDGGTGDATKGGTPTTDAGTTTTYAPVVIDFDDLDGNAVVTNQYATHATFSSTGANTIYTQGSASTFGTSPANFICSNGCGEDYDIDFTAPVKNLKINIDGVNDTGTVAQVNVFVSGSPAKTVDLVGAGSLYVPVPLDLSAFENVTRIEITNITDAAGFGLDDVSFDFPQ